MSDSIILVYLLNFLYQEWNIDTTHILYFPTKVTYSECEVNTQNGLSVHLKIVVHTTSYVHIQATATFPAGSWIKPKQLHIYMQHYL